jgi:hypothetical protein
MINMNKKTNIVILGNRQSEFAGTNDLYPAYLAERDGILVVERILNSCDKVENSSVVFTALESDAQQFHLIDIIKQISSDASLCITSNLTKGSACTALLAACKLDQDNELLILSANEIVDVDLSSYIENCRSQQIHASTIVFQSVHPRYSYVMIDKMGYISEIAQRDPISNVATTGLFWFQKTSDFVENAKEMIKSRTPVNGNYFVGLTLNELILSGKRVGFLRIPESMYIPLKDQVQSTTYQFGGENAKT